MSDHHHVIAVQDWGGRHMHGRGWDDRLTRAEAEKLAAELADVNHLLFVEQRVDLAEAKYGDRLDDLTPKAAVNGEWSAIWITQCGTPCRFEETFQEEWPEDWGEPHWTPTDPDEPRARHLHLVS